MLSGWIAEIDRALRATSGNRMPSEWAKKAECCDVLSAVPLDLPEPAPPELAAQTAMRNAPCSPVPLLNAVPGFADDLIRPRLVANDAHVDGPITAHLSERLCGRLTFSAPALARLLAAPRGRRKGRCLRAT